MNVNANANRRDDIGGDEDVDRVNFHRVVARGGRWSAPPLGEEGVVVIERVVVEIVVEEVHVVTFIMVLLQGASVALGKPRE